MEKLLAAEKARRRGRREGVKEMKLPQELNAKLPMEQTMVRDNDIEKMERLLGEEKARRRTGGRLYNMEVPQEINSQLPMEQTIVRGIP